METTENWTVNDEQLLTEMLARKERVKNTHIEPLRYLVEREMPYVYEHHSEIAIWMALNANKIRELLQPFDSGVGRNDALLEALNLIASDACTDMPAMMQNIARAAIKVEGEKE